MGVIWKQMSFETFWGIIFHFKPTVVSFHQPFKTLEIISGWEGVLEKRNSSFWWKIVSFEGCVKRFFNFFRLIYKNTLVKDFFFKHSYQGRMNCRLRIGTLDHRLGWAVSEASRLLDNLIRLLSKRHLYPTLLLIPTYSYFWNPGRRKDMPHLFSWSTIHSVLKSNYPLAGGYSLAN